MAEDMLCLLHHPEQIPEFCYANTTGAQNLIREAGGPEYQWMFKMNLESGGSGRTVQVHLVHFGNGQLQDYQN